MILQIMYTQMSDMNWLLGRRRVTRNRGKGCCPREAKRWTRKAGGSSNGCNSGGLRTKRKTLKSFCVYDPKEIIPNYVSAFSQLYNQFQVYKWLNANFSQRRLKAEVERLAREEARLPAPKWEWQIYQIRARGIWRLMNKQWLKW